MSIGSWCPLPPGPSSDLDHAPRARGHCPRRPPGKPTMISTLRLASLALATLLLAGCDPEERVLGSWELATIDGVGPAVAAPLRVTFPAGVFGADTLAADGVWHEVTLDALTLTLEPGGSYRERTVEAK